MDDEQHRDQIVIEHCPAFPSVTSVRSTMAPSVSAPRASRNRQICRTRAETELTIGVIRSPLRSESGGDHVSYGLAEAILGKSGWRRATKELAA